MNDELGTRMKNNYEDRVRHFLPRRSYSIIRLDGKAFHTYCRNLQKPFDNEFIDFSPPFKLLIISKFLFKLLIEALFEVEFSTVSK